jgi:thiol-disulfide isomerase/thioredoxin
MTEKTPAGGMMAEETAASGEMSMEETIEGESMDTAPTEAMGGMETPGEMDGETMPGESMEGGKMDDASPSGGSTGDGSMGAMAAWLSTPFTDVTTGQAFTIGDYQDKVVLVELMAVWCPTCRRQQEEMQAVYETLGMPDDVVLVSLDIDPNEDAAFLEEYASSTGFAWPFAVAPTETAREIADLYGSQFLNPPSAPMLIVDPQGEVHLLPFGVKSAADLQEQVELYRGEAM